MLNSLFATAKHVNDKINKNKIRFLSVLPIYSKIDENFNISSTQMQITRKIFAVLSNLHLEDNAEANIRVNIPSNTIHALNIVAFAR